MKMMDLQYKVIFLLLVFCLISCEGPRGPEGPTGPEGPSLAGDLVGFVTLVDQFGASLTDHSGVTVLIEGTALSATTDSSGRWMIPAVNTGTYTISFSKSGYGTSKSVGYQFVGGGQVFLGTLTLAPIPDFNVSVQTIEAVSLGKDIIILCGDILLSPSQEAKRKLRVFLGLNNSVSFEPEDYLLQSLCYTTEENTKFISSMPCYLADVGLINSSGTILYAIVYSSSGDDYDSGYTDLNTGKFIYTNLGSSPSEVMSTVVP
jgi:hypothetical protein